MTAPRELESELHVQEEGHDDHHDHVADIEAELGIELDRDEEHHGGDTSLGLAVLLFTHGGGEETLREGWGRMDG